MKKHTKRKGIGCSEELYPDEETIICCNHALNMFGGYYKCLAQKDCWMDKKVLIRFKEDKHCPNCSRPNKPFVLIDDDKYNQHCEKCKMKVHRMRVE